MTALQIAPTKFPELMTPTANTANGGEVWNNKG